MEVEYESANSGCSGAFERRRETSTTGGVEEKEEIWAADVGERINQKLDRILQMLATMMMNQNQGPQGGCTSGPRGGPKWEQTRPPPPASQLSKLALLVLCNCSSRTFRPPPKQDASRGGRTVCRSYVELYSSGWNSRVV